MTRRIACLTLDDPQDFVIDDPLMHAELRARGHQVSEVPWRHPACWDDYDLVIIRTPWDYQKAPDAFLTVLEEIAASSATLANNRSIVRWNLTKHYLVDLEQAGIPIVPTRWHLDGADRADIHQAFSAFGCPELIIKPLVSANADHTYRLPAGNWQAQADQLDSIFRDRPCLLQPFISTVTARGEWSLFFFGGRYSHAIRKIPKAGDFRVQEEHGADILAADAPESLQVLAASAMACAPGQLLYARVDFLTTDDHHPLLIELELIEPSLYFRMHPGAAHHFADAVERWPVASGTANVG